MKKVDKDVLVDASSRLLFTLKEEELDTLLEEFKILQAQMEMMKEVEGLEKYEPMTFPFDVSVDYLRDDVPSEPLSRDDVLKNAGSVKDGEIKLPKVVG